MLQTVFALKLQDNLSLSLLQTAFALKLQDNLSLYLCIHTLSTYGNATHMQ